MFTVHMRHCRGDNEERYQKTEEIVVDIKDDLSNTHGLFRGTHLDLSRAPYVLYGAKY